jgi:hypothetical protein
MSRNTHRAVQHPAIAETAAAAKSAARLHKNPPVYGSNSPREAGLFRGLPERAAAHNPINIRL